ncbi:MAG: DNA-processing protein DprA [Alphaproteobacteria bacterium]|nr:DNA-processing protein DprA [Alphaproteobacteria bacterium]
MNRRPLSPNEKRDWLRLARTENVGPITFRHLLQRFGSARAALEALPELARRGGKKKIIIPSPSVIDDELAGIEALGGFLIASCEPDYPEALAALEDSPPLLSLRGHTSLLKKRCIGLVGARNASLNGRKMAGELAKGLGEHDIVVVSGLARGIDTAAHQASLASGTIAVLAGGVDVVYPHENQGLYDTLCDVGCVISDMPLGLEPFSKLFPRRNRIISGLSLGVVVVEAALRSGSLITARAALDQGREVFAVPGSPLDPRCTGSNDLIRQGAVLTETANDILAHIHAMVQTLDEPPIYDSFEEMPSVDEASLAQAKEKILENLGPSPVSVDELVRECFVSPSVVLTVLLELDLSGRLERFVGNKVALIGSPCRTNSSS